MSPKRAPREKRVKTTHNAPLASSGFAQRLKEARAKTHYSQNAIAKYVGLRRSSVTQWESGNSTPPAATIEQVATLLNEEASWLAYGVRQGPRLVDPDPDALGYVLAREIRFGSMPEEMIEIDTFGLSTNYLRKELNVSNVKNVILFRCDTEYKTYEPGDLLIVDRNVNRPSPPGTFLIWDGMGPAVADINVIPAPMGKKAMAKVTTAYGTFEMEAEKCQIIGRVKGVTKKA